MKTKQINQTSKMRSGFGFAFIALAMLILNSACNTLTTKETTIKGLVYDQALEAPVAGIDVHLIQEEVSPMPFGPISGQGIAVTTTDAQGNFTFNEKLVDRSKYDYYVVLNASRGRYFGSGWNEFNFNRVTHNVEFEAGTNIPMVLQMVSYGNIQLEVTNSSSYPNLEFKMILIRNQVEWLAFSKNIAHGESVHNEIETTIPTGLNTLKWRIKGSGIDTTIVEEINVIPHQKQDYHFVFEG